MDSLNYKRYNIYFYSFLSLTILIGLFIRLKGLGSWPLTVDEYYIIASVRNILKHGLPEFANGGFYDRGILYQYLISGLLLLGIKAEFAGRIITVITNIVTIIPVYLISKKLSGKLLTSIIVFVFTFSIWEVEFARFARMYSPFQMIFMWYIYFLFRFLIDGDKKTVKWLFILSFISIFIYEGSIFLSVLNFIPLIWNPQNKSIEINFFKNKKFSYLAAALSIFIFTYSYLTTNFRTFGSKVSELLPTDISLDNIVTTTGTFRLPRVLLLNLPEYQHFLFIFIVLLVLSIFYGYKMFANKDVKRAAIIAAAILTILSILNLFGLTLVFFIIFYLIDLLKKNEIKQVIKFIIPISAIYFVFWTVFALNSTSWYKYFPNADLSSNISMLKVLWKEFFNYPFFYETYVLFRETIPNATYILMFLLISGTIYLFLNKNEKNLNLRILFSLLLLLIFFTDLLNLLYFQTRYFFFLYPLILLLTFSSTEYILNNFIRNNKLRTLSFISITLIVLILSEDFNLRHLLMIDSREYNYRVNLTRDEKDHYYPRWDTQTPAEFINRRLNENETVIINEQVYGYYLNKIDYLYYRYSGPDFMGITVENGKKERWTNANLIYDANDFKKLLDSKKNIWLLINTFYGNKDLDSINFFNDFNKYKVYADQDSVTFVYKIP